MNINNCQTPVSCLTTEEVTMEPTRKTQTLCLQWNPNSLYKQLRQRRKSKMRRLPWQEYFYTVLWGVWQFTAAIWPSLRVSETLSLRTLSLTSAKMNNDEQNYCYLLLRGMCLNHWTWTWDAVCQELAEATMQNLRMKPTKPKAE